MNMVTGTVSRRRRLSSLWFVCACERCRKPDLSRQLRCPKCNAPKCVPAEDQPDGDQEWSCEKPLEAIVPEVKAWCCSACGGTFGSQQMCLNHEERLSEDVPRVMQGRVQNA